MFYKIIIKNWEEIKVISKNSFHFCYRGHAVGEWELKPTLERAADKFLMDYDQLFDQEYLIIREFKSVSRQYLNQVPDPNNYIEWLALLQHHGAPTRLLDFSFSIYIAAFFAFETSTSESAIWAINRYRLNDFLIEKMYKDPKRKLRNLILHDYTIDVANNLLNHEDINVVNSVLSQLLDNKQIIFTVTPDNKSDRQSIQKSLFLMPSTVSSAFQEILIKQLNLEVDKLSEEYAKEITFDELINNRMNYNTSIFKLIIPRNVCLDGLKDLRNMNINAATLFPGLDGQARSLNYIMRSMEDIMLQIKERKN
ncbi:MAG: FRG domain-containing protein [Ignavibacteriales bacterium]|nr:FRG domain-containing protein [Ignavibacteriales bacterium]